MDSNISALQLTALQLLLHTEQERQKKRDSRHEYAAWLLHEPKHMQCHFHTLGAIAEPLGGQRINVNLAKQYVNAHLADAGERCLARCSSWWHSNLQGKGWLLTLTVLMLDFQDTHCLYQSRTGPSCVTDALLMFFFFLSPNGGK